jgi:hypothetical protein
MCLVLAQKPKKQSGIGWKLVYDSWDNEKKEYVYHPQFRTFRKNGHGGTALYYTPHEAKLYLYQTKPPMYRIGKTHTVRHKNTALDSKGNVYHAGVHLYLDRPFHIPPLMRVLECRYDEAIVEDGKTVVALKVTPIADVTKECYGG